MVRKANVINVDFSKPRATAAEDLKGQVKDALRALNSTSQEILIDMFGLRDGNVRSVYEVAHRAGIEALRVEDISNSALRSLFFRPGGARKSS